MDIDYEFVVNRITDILNSEYEINMATEVGLRELDLDQSGDISLNEFYPAYVKLFAFSKLPEPTFEEVEKTFNRFDLDKSKTLSKEEFRSFTIEDMKSMKARFEEILRQKNQNN
jgi:hypothetical protein